MHVVGTKLAAIGVAVNSLLVYAAASDCGADKSKKVELVTVVATDGKFSVGPSSVVRPGTDMYAKNPSKACAWSVISKTGHVIRTGGKKEAKRGLSISSRAGKFNTQYCGPWVKF